MSEQSGAGSLTALPVIETQAGDVSAVRLGKARLGLGRLYQDPTSVVLTCRGIRPPGTIAWPTLECCRKITTSATRYHVTSINNDGSEGEEDRADLSHVKSAESISNEEQKSLNDLNGRYTTKRATKGSPQWTLNRGVVRYSTTPGDQGKSKNEVGDRSVISNLENTSDQNETENNKDRLMETPEERTVDGNDIPRNVAEENPQLEREGYLEVKTEVKANIDKSMPEIQYIHPGSVSYEDIYNLDNLKAGYAKLKSNVAAGIDGRTKTDITEKGLMKLSKQLKNQTYKPKPAKRIMIANGQECIRPISMASAVDKVVQSTLKLLIEPYFESQFRDKSHGFRAGRSCHTALRELRGKWTSMTWLIKIEIKKYFDKIHHDLLLKEMAPVLHTRSLQDLMNKLLKAGYVDVYNLPDRTQYEVEGVPQGSLISPLCANIFLHKLDCYVEDELIPKYTVGEIRPMRKEYGLQQSCKQHLKFNDKHKAFIQEYPELKPALENIKHRRWILNNEPSREPNYNACFLNIKYLRYADDILIGVIGNRKHATDIRKDIQEYLSNELQLEINEEKSAIYHAKTERCHFLGAEIIYRDTSKIITENTDRGVPGGEAAPRFNTEISNIKRIKLQPITRAQLYIPIKKLLKRSIHRGYAKENAKGLARATANSRLSASEDKHIVKHFSAVIRRLVNYYSFANKRSSL